MINEETVRKLAESKLSPKEVEILEVASALFLKHGFDGTSINAMARASGISKESIYRYFSSKKVLFEAVVTRELAEYQKSMDFLDGEIVHQDLEAALVSTATAILNVINNERTLALRRLIFQEVASYPEIGRFYYDTGPAGAYELLERVFAKHRDRTDFDLQSLGRYFVGMILHNLLLRRQCGLVQSLSEAEQQALAENATRDFLAAFFKA